MSSTTRRIAPRSAPSRPPGPTRPCPFTVVVDSNEQLPYQFSAIAPHDDRSGVHYAVPTVRERLAVGDYTVAGLRSIIVERKSAADFYSWIGREDNVRRRLILMEKYAYACVVVEDDVRGLVKCPPPFAGLNPLSAMAYVRRYAQEYSRVHWWFMPGRRVAEVWTFRLLERHFRKHDGDGT